MNSLKKRLKQLRTEHGLSKTDFSKVAGVEKSSVGKWEEGITSPKEDKLKNIAAHFNVSIEWLKTGIDKNELISTVNQNYTLIEHIDNEGSTLLFDRRQLPSENNCNLVYFNVEASNLGELLPKGSVIIVDKEDTNVKDDKIYLIKNDNFFFIRRLSYTTTGISVQNLGEVHREALTFQELSKLKIIGRVITSICPR